MMGREAPLQSKLFYTDFDLERCIRATHPLHRIAQRVDFNFAYQEVADAYGDNGNVSVPLLMVLKLMLLLVPYNVRSERELMVTLPERLNWLWYLEFDLDSPAHDHNVLYLKVHELEGMLSSQTTLFSHDQALFYGQGFKTPLDFAMRALPPMLASLCCIA